jgi:hypothetical protein
VALALGVAHCLPLRRAVDLQTPVIVLQGTADTIQYPRNSLVFTKRVIEAGRSDRLRLYILKGVGHGPQPPFPLQAQLDAVEQLKHWVDDGTSPGLINAGTAASPVWVPNNRDALRVVRAEQQAGDAIPARRCCRSAPSRQRKYLCATLSGGARRRGSRTLI